MDLPAQGRASPRPWCWGYLEEGLVLSEQERGGSRQAGSTLLGTEGVGLKFLGIPGSGTWGAKFRGCFLDPPVKRLVFDLVRKGLF